MMWRLGAICTVAVGTSVGLAAPVSAEPLVGTYTAEVIGNDGTTLALQDSPWVITSCGADCARANDREFRLQGSTWTSSSDEDGDGVVCTTTIDAGSLTGTTGCGFMTFPVKLTKVG